MADSSASGISDTNVQHHTGVSSELRNLAISDSGTLEDVHDTILDNAESDTEYFVSELIKPDNFDLIVEIGNKLSSDKQKPALNVG